MRDAILRATLSALFLCGGAAGALTPPDVELVRPAPGEVLVGGGEGVVEWTLRGAPLDPAVEEWEAFLSFNGGGFFAVRLTPHLDADRRRFAFRVPAVATEDARILLRFGDEVREVGVDVPHRFAIRLPPYPVPVERRPAPGRGEAARPGEPGVVAWVEGTRQGEGLTLVQASLPPAAGPVVEGGAARAPTLLTPRSPDAPVLTLADERARPSASRPLAAAAGRVLPAAPILLLGCRQNE
jgi:hypothetical protein